MKYETQISGSVGEQERLEQACPTRARRLDEAQRESFNFLKTL